MPIDNSPPPWAHPVLPARVVLHGSLAGAPPERQEFFDAAVAAALDQIGQGEVLNRRLRGLVARLSSNGGSELGESRVGASAHAEQRTLP